MYVITEKYFLVAGFGNNVRQYLRHTCTAVTLFGCYALKLITDCQRYARAKRSPDGGDVSALVILFGCR